MECVLGGKRTMCFGGDQQCVCVRRATANFLCQEIHMKMYETVGNCYITNFLRPKPVGGNNNSGPINS